MDYYVSAMSDVDPESGRRYLPEGVTIANIYEQYKALHEDEGPVTLSHFRNLWTMTMKGEVSGQRKVIVDLNYLVCVVYWYFVYLKQYHTTTHFLSPIFIRV